MNNLIPIFITLLFIVTSCDANIDDDPIFNTTIIDLRTYPEIVRTNSQVEFEVIISDSLNMDNYEFTWGLADSEIRTTSSPITLWNTPKNAGNYEIAVLVIDEDPSSSNPSKNFIIEVIE